MVQEFNEILNLFCKPSCATTTDARSMVVSYFYLMYGQYLTTDTLRNINPFNRRMKSLTLATGHKM